MGESSAGRVAAAAVLVFVALLQIHRIDDSDTWWHLASGRHMAETGEVVATDPFSFTARGQPWINRQWLFDLGLERLWNAGGPGAASLAAGALFLVAFAALLARARRSAPGVAAAFLVLLAAMTAVERFTVRPEAVTLCALGMVLLLLDRRIDGWVVSALVAVQLVWANCHALSVIGILPVGAELAAGAGARWVPLPAGWRQASQRSPAELRWLGVAVAGGLLAEAATPFGIEGALYPLWLLTIIRGQHATSASIVEHRPLAFAELSPAAAVAVPALLGLGALAILVSFRRLRLSSVLCAAAFTALALMARRNVALLGFGLAPLAADGLGPPLAGLLRRRKAVAVCTGLGVGALAAWLCAAVITGRFYDAAHLTRSFGLGESRMLFPAAAVDFLTEAAPEARVFNDDFFGGWLLWRTSPPRPVFIDGRLQVYPPALYEEYLAALEDPARFAETAARWHIGAVILHHPGPGRLELASAIARLPGWRVAYLDASAVVLLADGKPPGVVAGASGPIEGPATPGIAGQLERVAGRPEREAATAHYQRGRALLWLYGAAAMAPARADFEAALGQLPDFDPARTAMAVIERAARAPAPGTSTAPHATPPAPTAP